MRLEVTTGVVAPPAAKAVLPSVAAVYNSADYQPLIAMASGGRAPAIDT